MQSSSCSILLALTISICVVIVSTAGAAASDDDEVSALLAIKSVLVDPLDALRSWNPPSPHCNWTGVQCSADGFVSGLDLSGLNISGDLSVEGLAHLPRLAAINLCCNSFTNSFPKTLPRLPHLQLLDVSDNNFVGGFPSGVGSALPSLTVLNASSNNFVGPLPDDIGNATALEVLDFRGSFFTGSIPKSYKHLKKLMFLGLSGNNLTGELPAELGELTSLETIIIGYNEFQGRIPPEFGNLTNLRYVDMAIGSLEGPLPAELGRLQLLDTVYLYKNNLDGEIPREIGNTSSLVYFDVSDNQLSGSIPPELALLSNLQLLNLMCNKLEGPVPAGIGELRQLQVLELWNNSLVGPLPATLGLNSPLQWLDVSSNLFTGEIPQNLCKRASLTKLILFNNGFSGPVPSGLTSCRSLVRVRMHNNRLNGSVPAGLGQLPRLQRLELAGNDLTGKIPDDISLSASLSFIDVSHNHLHLALPSSILSIPTLQTFMASDNSLTGPVPDQFQDYPTLSAVDLSNNRLSGGIPTSLSSCERLVSLILSGNELTGEIPTAISMMPTLAILDLSNNQLTGSIPHNFGNSPALETLNLSHNNLSGPVPANGVLRTINPDELAGNAGLCGDPLPPCNSDASFKFPSRAKLNHIKHIVAGWLIGLSAVLSIGMGAILVHRLYERWQQTRFSEESGAWPWRLTAFQRLNFTSTDILACIKESNVIGMGATGIVYKAEMPRRHVTLAIKKLWRVQDGASTAGDFAGEVSLLGKLRHRNIVRMMGYIHNDVDAMIVYEYMPNGNLWGALHGEESAGRVLVDWVSRYNVALGVAQGLAYLHHDCHPPVIHRDVKSNNILLDANLDARIADFGLARMMVSKNETLSMVAGSYGYIAPEYGYTLKVDEKSDIYSFGVVLMELVTGKRPIEAEYGEGQDIVGWLREQLRSGSGAVEGVLDKGIGGHCRHIREEMLLVLRVAVLCTAQSPKERPTMRDVLSMLGEAKPRRKSNGATSTAAVVVVVDKDKPVFTPVADDAAFM